MRNDEFVDDTSGSSDDDNKKNGCHLSNRNRRSHSQPPRKMEPKKNERNHDVFDMPSSSPDSDIKSNSPNATDSQNSDKDGDGTYLFLY